MAPMTFEVEDQKRLVVHFKKEPFDVYIGRGSYWGNPFSEKSGTKAIVKVDSREEAIAMYREWLLTQPDMLARARQELKGKILGCWCYPKPCHGDVLVELVNV
jgi:hypothetical protein